MLDDDVIAAFRARAEAEAQGHQTLINAALRAAIDPEAAPVTVATFARCSRSASPWRPCTAE